MSDAMQPTDPRLSDELFRAAANAIGSVVETHYTHDLNVDADAGIYDLDCSGFVSFLLGRVAAEHLATIAGSTADSRPLARDYYAFAAGLSDTSQRGWRPVMKLPSLNPGDIVAWELPGGKGDTGHVFVVAAREVATREDGIRSVLVHDASSVPHFDGSRGPGKPFATGIGTGGIQFQVNGDGHPTAFRFGAGAGFETVPIAMMRVLPFSDS